MRAETRENLRLIKQVEEHGRYWKVTDPTPERKEWKTNSVLIDGDESLERVYEAGRRACGGSRADCYDAIIPNVSRRARAGG
jgi:hypothetical protein